MLLDSGAIEDDAAGRWLVHHDLLAAVHVPPTLAGVLQARLDALAAPHRVALQQASVIGFRFWDHALSAVDRQSVPALRPLAQRSLISAADATAIPGALEFTFKHHLLQQFTYDSVLKRDRRDYHARAARWLAALVEDGRRDLLGAAGDHFARAGEFAEAAEYFASAAEAARSRDARAAALDEATRGLALDDVAASVRWRLLVVREAVRALGGDPDGHLDDLDALEAVAEELDDDQRRAEAALRRGVALLDRGDHRDGEAAVRHAVELAARTANGRVEAVAVAELARAARRTNRNEEACDLATASLALARDLGDRRLEVQALAELAAAHGALGNIVDDLAISTEALELCPSTGDRVLEARLLNSMGVGLFATGAFDEARRSWRASVSLSQEIEWGYGEAIARLNLTGLAVSEGRYDEAVEVGVAARDAAASGGWRDLEAAASLHLGIGLHRRGDLADARATLEHSYALFLANDGPHYALDPLAALAVLDLDEGRADDALDKVAQVLDYVAAGGSLSSMEEPYRVRWDCYCVLGRLDDPRAPDVLGEARQAMTVTAATLPPEQRARWLRNDPYLRALLEAHPPFTPEAADDQRDRV